MQIENTEKSRGRSVLKISVNFGVVSGFGFRVSSLLPCVVAALLLGGPAVLRAQDDVTIPKSRLEELERKERELERLKGDVNKTKDENAQLKTQLQQAVTNTPVAAAPVRVSPPLASLPAFKEGQVVESVDLANYYKADKGAADQRFKNRHFTVRGEIMGFEKPLYVRNYRIILQGGDRETKVICDFYPNEKFNAVFSTQHGSQLVALMGETRVPLAKVGQEVLVEGTCKGWRESAVLVSAGSIKPAGK